MLRRTNACLAYFGELRSPQVLDGLQLYRTKQEIEAWREHDPIRQLQSWLAQTGLMR